MFGANVLATIVIGNDKAFAVWDIARRDIVLDNLSVASSLDPLQNRVVYEQFFELVFGQSCFFYHGWYIIETLAKWRLCNAVSKGYSAERSTMVVDRRVELLEALLSGRIYINEFGQGLSDELFQLRQDATPTEDKTLLSRIQLYLHEFEEGNRDIHDVYIAAQAALDLTKPSSISIQPKTKIFVQPSEPGDVVPTSSSPPPDFSELPELQLV